MGGRSVSASHVRGRFLLAALASALVLALACAGSPGPDLEGLPTNGRALDADRVLFRFAVVSDRTGGHRPGVFRAATDVLNLLRPDFVMSVGDLIEGDSDDRAAVDAEWDEFEAMVDALEMPFFYTAGNHDYSNPATVEAWNERRGASYYSFEFRNHLFIVVSTEDPPFAVDKDRMRDLWATARRDPDEYLARWREIIVPSVSDTQLDWLEETLGEHPDVRWTFVFMHKAAWQWESPAVERIYSALRGRQHTVFGGHDHNYKATTIHGADFIRLGATGGAILPFMPAEGNFDHVTWVSVLDDGPVISNIELTGVRDKTGAPVAERP